jgi:hypothetical protein
MSQVLVVLLRLCREDDVEGSLRLILDELKGKIDKREGGVIILLLLAVFFNDFSDSVFLVTSRIIDVDVIQNIVADLSSDQDDIAHESFQVE